MEELSKESPADSEKSKQDIPIVRDGWRKHELNWSEEGKKEKTGGITCHCVTCHRDMTSNFETIGRRTIPSKIRMSLRPTRVVRLSPALVHRLNQCLRLLTVLQASFPGISCVMVLYLFGVVFCLSITGCCLKSTKKKTFLGVLVLLHSPVAE